VDLKDRRIAIASPDDRERLVAELWYDGEIWGEVNQEQDELAIEIYPSKSRGAWRFTLAELERILQEAKETLMTS